METASLTRDPLHIAAPLPENELLAAQDALRESFTFQTITRMGKTYTIDNRRFMAEMLNHHADASWMHFEALVIKPRQADAQENGVIIAEGFNGALPTYLYRGLRCIAVPEVGVAADPVVVRNDRTGAAMIIHAHGQKPIFSDYARAKLESNPRCRRGVRFGFVPHAGSMSDMELATDFIDGANLLGRQVALYPVYNVDGAVAG